MRERDLLVVLKNRKMITLWYQKDEDLLYTVNLAFKNEMFVANYYYLDGNDVFDEDNYNDEHTIETAEFNTFLATLKTLFPGMIENWNNYIG